jgi:hypothetical protein
MSTDTSTMTTQQVAERFAGLAREEAWFQIQDELFAENVKSLEPPDSPWLQNAEGKRAVREKGEAWVGRITAAHKRHTTEPIVGENHFVVGRDVDIDVQGLGRVRINQLMLFEVKEGRIVSEQFFY